MKEKKIKCSSPGKLFRSDSQCASNDRIVDNESMPMQPERQYKSVLRIESKMLF